MRIVNLWVGFLNKLRGLHKPVFALKLQTKSEFLVLRHLDDIAEIRSLPLEMPGVWTRLIEAHHVSAEILKSRLQGRLGGAEPPPLHDGANGALMSGVVVCRVKDAIHLPEYGAVITPNGEALQSSIAEALYLTPSLAALPGVSTVDGQPAISIPKGAPALKRAAVFMAWGGRYNYGHFMLDCLSALISLDEVGLLEKWRPIAPALNSWQKEGLRLLLGEEKAAAVREIDAPVIHVEDLVFASPMDHFLHAPNYPLNIVRERMLAAIDEPSKGPSHIYISRLGDLKRPLVNEDVLEAALITRGFTSVAPEKLSLSKQIALFRDADVIVGASGAALANVLFCKPEAKVFEIQPTNFVGIWARGVAHFVGAYWYSFYAPSPLYEKEIFIEGAQRFGLEFRWKISVEEFLGWLDDSLRAADMLSSKSP